MYDTQGLSHHFLVNNKGYFLASLHDSSRIDCKLALSERNASTPERAVMKEEGSRHSHFLMNIFKNVVSLFSHNFSKFILKLK